MKQILRVIAALLATMLLFETTHLDLFVQHGFYDENLHRWLWDRNEPVSRLLLYDGIKRILILCALGIFVALLFFSRHPLIFSRRRGLWLLLLSLILVPATVGILKDTTNVACPRSLREFGGTLPYVHVFEAYPVQQRPARKQLCFPAGHASGGFALFALMYVFSSRRNRRLALAFGFTLGWLMGGYKMLIGDHFLSHTIVSMLLAWLLVSLLGLAEHTPAENLEKDR